MRLALIVALLVFIAGCVSSLTEPIQVSSEETRDIADILEVVTEEVFPTPIYPGDSFTLHLVVKNIHESEVARNVKCYIADAGIFHASKMEGEKADLYPGDSEVYEFGFIAPGRQIVTNTITSDIEYVCRYSGTARSTLTYNVFDWETAKDYQVAGQTLSGRTSFAESAGPVKINLEPANPYFIAGREGKIKARIENIGSYGMAGGSRMNVFGPGSVSIYIEAGQTKGCSIRYAGPSSFSCSTAEIEGVRFCKCVNQGKIRLVNGMSPEMTFSFNIPDDAAPGGRKTFAAKGEVAYNYFIRKVVPIDVMEA